MSEQKLVRGGAPVAPDVELLLRELGLPEPGPIPHERLERALGVKRSEARYKTVTWAWRERLWNEHNVRVVGLRDGSGFACIVGDERLVQSERQRAKARRRVMQSMKEAVTTPEEELDAAGKLRREHLVLSGARLVAGHSTAQLEYREALKKLPESLPKREPGH
jgi:hypothetical protein